MTSMPASRNARAMTLAPRSWPSRPGLATRTRILGSGIGSHLTTVGAGSTVRALTTVAARGARARCPRDSRRGRRRYICRALLGWTGQRPVPTRASLRFHSQLPKEEGIHVGVLFDLFSNGLALSVAGFGFDAQQDGLFFARAVFRFG